MDRDNRMSYGNRVKDDDGYYYNIWTQAGKACDKRSVDLRERMANRKFLRRLRGRRVPTRNPQGLNKPPNERG